MDSKYSTKSPCCGINSFHDYQIDGAFHNVPISCCNKFQVRNNESERCESLNEIFNNGCRSNFFYNLIELKFHFNTAFLIDLELIAIELLSALLTYRLIKQINEDANQDDEKQSS